MESLILNMPAAPAEKINYMFALATCENYRLPTTSCLSVQDMIGDKIYSWYKDMIAHRSDDEIAWYNNYE